MNSRNLGLLTCLFAVPVMVAGCGSDAQPSITPTISIASPVGGSTVTIDAQQASPVVFSTENFTLKAQGTVGCGVGCGNVHLLIDGDSCTPTGMSANATGSTSPITAQFASCTAPVGSHKITLELHNADDTPLLDASGKVVSASVSITTIMASSGAPSIAITTPTAGASVTLGVDVNKSVPVAFTTQNFTLAAPGTPSCGTGCGHVNVRIDGAACDSAGHAYNATGSATPISALFAFCSTATGSHTISLELHNDDDTLVPNVSPATVMITTQ